MFLLSNWLVALTAHAVTYQPFLFTLDQGDQNANIWW
jgi:hypothetical protein